MMDVQEEPIPLITLQVGNHGTHGAISDSESQDSMRVANDPNKFNAYLNRGSELWTHWTWLGGQGKMSLMRCNYCLVNKQLKNAPKCRRHLIKCQRTPELVRKYFERKEMEASRVSAFMREIRSKDFKFARNEAAKNMEQNDQQKVPMPTANDLKHLHQKQQATSIMASNKTNNTNISKTAMNGSNGNSSSNNKSTNNSIKYSPITNINNNNSQRSKISINSENKNNNQSSEQSMNQATNPDSIESQSPILSQKLKRKLNENGHHTSMIVNSNGAAVNGKDNNGMIIDESTTNTPLQQQQKKSILVNATNTSVNANNTVVINLDDMSMDDPIYYNASMENGHHVSPNDNSILLNGSSRKIRRRDSSNGGFNNNNKTYRNGTTNEINGRNGFNNQNHHVHHHQNEFSNLDLHDIEIVHDDLNDLLMSALISQGIEPEFVNNSYFQKFITQLVKFSTSSKNYRLPAVDKLIANNVGNLMRKFDYETTKVFSECDSIIVSFECNNNDDDGLMPMMAQSNGSSYRRLNYKNSIVNHHNEKRLDVNLLISTSNTCLNLFYKTIYGLNKTDQIGDGEDQSENEQDQIDIKSLNSQIDSLFNKLGPAQINAVILPYKDKASSELIYSYLTTCHSHIVPLTNSYQLFHHLLSDICKIPSIYRLITQCMSLFQQLETDLFEFHEENQNHWKRVFESDNLKIFKHFANGSCKNTYWISLNLMLCWFLVARSSIINLFEKEDLNDDVHNKLNKIMDKCQLEVSQLETFFDQISILFNFLTPFINAMHLIENESTVISDIVKIYFDVKLAINNKNFFNDINKVCDKTERQAIDSILNEYLQEHNFSRYFFLAYYLDPRFRDDHRIEEDGELTAQVYDALFNYANALGCVNNEEEDREKLVDSLEEFRNGDKLYGMQLLKSPKSPCKFWKHLRRFPASSQLAYCASRLLSISTHSMLMTTPVEDNCTNSLYEKILNQSDNEMELLSVERLLPIKSYLLASCQKISIIDEDDNGSMLMKQTDGLPTIKNGYMDNGQYDGTNNNGNGSSWNHCSTNNISNIISNVITSLDQYTMFVAKPFSTSDLTSFIQRKK